MKTALKIIAVVVVVIVAILVGLTLFVKSYLRSDKLKSLLIPRIETYAGRKAEIADISVSIFESLTVKGFSLKEKDGQKDFIQAKELVLKYQFWPILKRHLIIDEAQLTAPAISVFREPDGNFNFTDIKEKLEEATEKKPAPAPQEAKMTFTVAAETIVIDGASFQFVDARKEMPGISALADLKLKFSMLPTGSSATGHIDLRSLRAAFPGGEAETSGKIDIEETMNFNLNTRIGADIISMAGSVNDYMKTPEVRLDIASKELHLDKLAALAGPQEPAAPAKASPPPNATVSGNVNIALADYMGYQIRDFKLTYAYKNGAVNLSQITGAFAGGDKVSSSGTFNAGLTFSYGTSDTIKRTLAGTTSVKLDNIQLKETEISRQAAALLGIPDLVTLLYNQSEFHADLKGGTVTLDGFMNSQKVRANPIKGTVGFIDKGMNMTVDLQLSPDLSSKLPGQITQFLASQQGWSTFPLTITGTTEKPSVGLNKAALGGEIREGLEQQLRKGLEELIPGRKQGEQQEQKSPEDILKGLFR